RGNGWPLRSVDGLDLRVQFRLGMVDQVVHSRKDAPMSRLRNGQPFPLLEVPAVGGGTISLPDDLAGSYGVVLIYRGSWCLYCNAQLAAFSRAAGALTELGVRVVALSVDDEETSAALVARHKLPFPLGHSADAGKVAAATGAYVNDEPH